MGLTSLAFVLRSAYELSTAVAGTLAWSLAAHIYNTLFFRGRLIPRWLSLWGIVGAVVSIMSCTLGILREPRSPGLSDHEGPTRSLASTGDRESADREALRGEDPGRRHMTCYL